MAEIKLLKDFPECAPVCAYWSYNLWYRNRPIDYSTIITAYRSRAVGNRIPITWIALEESMPVGMATLKKDDLWSRKDINPWLASLYVVPEFRRNGIAEQLIQSVIAGAGEFGYDTLYLFLGSEKDVDLGAYYEKRGWRYREDTLDNDGHPTKIYFYTI